MWDELSVERAVSDDELAAAAARAMGIDRERICVVASIEHAPATHGRPTPDGAAAPDRILLEARAHAGDFALRVGFYRVPDAIDRVAFYRAFAAALACKLLVADGDVDPYTAMLVTPDGGMVRVDLDPEALDRDDEAIVIAGLHQHVETDEPPDPTAHAPEPPANRRRFRRTRGERLAQTVNDYLIDGTPPDPDAFMAAYTPEVQDAEYELTALLRELVHRTGTPDDERVLRRTTAVLRRGFPDLRAAGAFLAEIVRCADEVLARLPWDPAAP